MRIRRGRAALLVAVFVGAAVHGSSPPDAGPPEEDGVRERVLVRRAHWPVLIEPVAGLRDAPRLCASLAAGQVEVLEDGVPARVTALGPRPLPRLHALLIDTSRSMLDSGLLEAAKRAAAEYVDSLPADEPALLASFDVSLVLAAPPSTDRERLREAIDELGPVSNGTALWDAAYYLVAYLGPQPEEKVLVLLTDGEDSDSLPGNTARRVADLAAATANLTVFSIRMVRPAERQGLTARGALTGLARQTGGEYFEIEEASALDRVYRRICERMDGRLYVSYAPPPFGSGPRDRKSGNGFRWREVRVRAADGVPCRVTALRAPERFEAERGTPVPGRGVPAYFNSPGPGAQISGRASDLLVATGPLYDAGRLLDAGKLQATVNREPLHAMRHVVVEASDLTLARSEIASPEDLLLHMLRRDLPAPASILDDPSARPAFLVDGYTFLEMREVLGRALIERRPDYRRWAEDRLAVRVEAEIHSLVARAPQANGLTAEEMVTLRAALLADASSPEEGTAHLLVAEWLGDVPARQVALDLERRVADRLLADSDADAREEARAVERGWHKLGLWFPPAVGSRVLTPLIPAWEPATGRVGFYRFVLAWPHSFDERPRTVPVRPLALATVHWLLDRPETAEVLAGRARVVALDYPPNEPRTLRGVRCPAAPSGLAAEAHGADLPERTVIVELEGPPPAAGRTALRAWFANGDVLSSAPLCVGVESIEGGGEAGRRLSERLGVAIAAAGRLAQDASD